MISSLRNIAGHLLREKRDPLLGILGASLALGVGMPLPLTVIVAIVLLLLSVGLVREVRAAIKLYEEKHIPLVVVAGRKDEEVTAMLIEVMSCMKTHGFDEKRFEADFNLDRDHWLVRRESDLPSDAKDWENLVHRFEDKVIKLSAKLKGRKVFHIFINCPGALAVGLGAVLGTKYEVALHHFQRSDISSPYTLVIDLATAGMSSKNGAHIIKTKVTQPYQFVQVKWPDKLGETTLVSLHFAFHDPTSDATRQAVERSLPVVFINNALGTTLPSDSDWLLAAREIATVLVDIASRYEVRRVELLLSCPIPLAFAVGIAIGTQAPISIQSWFPAEQRYYEVLSLEKLRQPR